MRTKTKTSNLLVNTNPELLTEWDYEKNSTYNIDVHTVTCGSNIKAWWLCQKCHGSYDMSVSKRIHGRKCPYCAGKRVLRGYNDLESCYPNLVASEWDWLNNDRHNVKPYEIIKCSHKQVWWHCDSCDGSYEMAVQDKTRGQGCPYCAGKRVLKGFNDLLTLYPELISEQWDYEHNNANSIYPYELTKGAHVEAWWHCKTCYGSYEMMVNVKMHSTGCPYCMGKRVLAGFNDLATVRPDLLEQWDYVHNDANNIYPSEITIGSHRKIWWHCNTCSGSYEMVVSDKAKGNQGCPICAGKQVLIGFNDFASQYPELMKEWDWVKNDYNGIKPDMLTKGSHAVVHWLCMQCGGSYSTMLKNRTMGIQNCPFCAGVKILPGFNDLETLHPDLMNEWDYELNNANGIYPNKINRNSEIKAHWICGKFKHKWTTRIVNRTYGNNGCPKCNHRISAQEDEVADYITDYLRSHYVYMNYTMFRSIKFKRVYEMKDIDYENVLSDDLQSHLLKELDIYIPELGLAVEYDGDYWHSDEVVMRKTGYTNSEIHEIKKSLCEQAYIKIIFITEHDWLNDSKVCEHYINNILEESLKNKREWENNFI